MPNNKNSVKTLYRGIAGPWDQSLVGHGHAIIWATESKEDAEDYVSGQPNSQVVQVTLDLKNPADMDNDQKAIDLVSKLGLDPENVWDLTYSDEARAALQAAGYDGVVVYHWGAEAKHYGVFGPEQIRPVGVEAAKKPEVFLGGEVKTEWRDDIIKEFKDTLKLIDPMDPDWEPETSIYEELTDALNADEVVFFKGGDGTEGEQQVLDAAGVEYEEFDDLDELADHLETLSGLEITASDDQAYLKAVQSGDLETVQSMVAQEATAHGYTVGPMYHGTKATQLEGNQFSEKYNRSTRPGFYFTSEKSYAGRYGTVLSAYLKINKPIDTTSKEGTQLIIDLGHKANKGESWEDVAIREGYDAALIFGWDELKVFNASQIKSSDPVTYDDAGAIIPLSQRFTDSLDIRSSRIANITLPIKVGDEIMTGHWKNHRVKVKTIGKGKDGMPTINGKPITTIRIPKLMPDKKVKKSSNNDRDYYQREGCPYFALALNELFGYQIKMLVDEGTTEEWGDQELPTVAHVFVTDQKGNAIDSKGVRTVDEVKSDFYDLEEPRVTDVSSKELQSEWMGDDLPLFAPNQELVDQAKQAAQEFVPELFKKASLSIIQRVLKTAQYDHGCIYKSSSIDDAYMAAIETDDMATVQRLVKESAHAAGYNIGPVYHGTVGEFSEFDPIRADESGFVGRGFYFAENSEIANSYAGKKEGTPRLISAFLKMENPYNARKDKERTRDLAAKSGDMQDYFKSKGYDSVLFNDARVTNEQVVKYKAYVVFDPSQIKSADPITYDDSGQVIPLSQRFNSGTNDIRASLTKISAVLKEAQYDHGCVMVSAPDELRRHILKEIVPQIPEDYLEKDKEETVFGTEPDSHVTVLWGIETTQKDMDLIRTHFTAPITVKSLPEIGYFDNEETAAYLKVDSPDLHKLHNILKKELPNIDDHDEYVPHITIAYLEKGKRLDIDHITPFEWKVTKLIISKPDGTTEDLWAKGYEPEHEAVELISSVIKEAALKSSWILSDGSVKVLHYDGSNQHMKFILRNYPEECANIDQKSYDPVYDVGKNHGFVRVSEFGQEVTFDFNNNVSDSALYTAVDRMKDAISEDKTVDVEFSGTYMTATNKMELGRVLREINKKLGKTASKEAVELISAVIKEALFMDDFRGNTDGSWILKDGTIVELRPKQTHNDYARDVFKSENGAQSAFDNGWVRVIESAIDIGFMFEDAVSSQALRTAVDMMMDGIQDDRRVAVDFKDNSYTASNTLELGRLIRQINQKLGKTAAVFQNDRGDVSFGAESIWILSDGVVTKTKEDHGHFIINMFPEPEANKDPVDFGIEKGFVRVFDAGFDLNLQFSSKVSDLAFDSAVSMMKDAIDNNKRVIVDYGSGFGTATNKMELGRLIRQINQKLGKTASKEAVELISSVIKEAVVVYDEDSVGTWITPEGDQLSVPDNLTHDGFAQKEFGVGEYDLYRRGYVRVMERDGRYYFQMTNQVTSKALKETLHFMRWSIDQNMPVGVDVSGDFQEAMNKLELGRLIRQINQKLGKTSSIIKNAAWYHGSSSGDINQFNTRRTSNKMGVYFSDSKQVAENMHGSKAYYLYTVDLTPSQVLDLTEYDENSTDVAGFLNKLPVSEDFKRSVLYNGGGTVYPFKTLEQADARENLVPKLKRKGYDAITFNENGATTMVVFDSNAISIVGIENNKEKTATVNFDIELLPKGTYIRDYGGEGFIVGQNMNGRYLVSMNRRATWDSRDIREVSPGDIEAIMDKKAKGWVKVKED